MLVSIASLGLSNDMINDECCDEKLLLSKSSNPHHHYKQLKVKKSVNHQKWNRSFGRNTWILDSGSTAHMKFSKEGMTDLTEWKSAITFSNKEIIYSQMK